MTRNISVLILTFNEESVLEGCINSVNWSDDIVIMDSYSTDQTVSIANRYKNIRFIQRYFDNYSNQRNFALHEINYKNEWVFIIDADEICPDDLKEEMMQVIKNCNHDVIVFSLRRKTFFCNKWIKHNSIYPVWIQRLVRPQRVIYEGKIHEKLKYNGKYNLLKNHIYHYPFEKGISHWISRRNNYSSICAEEEYRDKPNINLKELFSGNPIIKRNFLNALYRRFPLRWFIYFLYNIFIKLCFLDGAKGIYYTLLETYYELLIVVKIKYIKHTRP